MHIRDLSDNPRLKTVVQILKDASLAREPADVFRVFGPRMWQIRPIEFFISASTRGLAKGSYKVTRYYDVAEFQRRAAIGDTGMPETVNPNPWATFHQLPTYTTGFVADCIRDGTPKILTDLHIDDDPVFGDLLKPYRSAIASPLFDSGEVKNWSIQLRRAPDAFDEARFEDAFMLGNLIGSITRNLVALKEVERLNKMLNAQFEEVARVQQSLLPEKTPEIPGLAVATSYLTSDQAGGDYYDFLPMPGNKLGILVADVSGHGAGAATIMAMLRAILHCYSGGDGSAAGVLRFANHRLVASRLEGNFVTAFFGVFDPETARLNYASAGHNPPRFLDSQNRSIRGIEDGAGLPLGITEDLGIWSEDLQLSPGDSILLYTDGITEAFGAQGTDAKADMFGIERLDAAILASDGRPDTMIENIHKALFEHTRARTRADDQTLVALQYVGPDRCLYPPLRREV
ncbi:MAG: PP2C family protein-serine/threonine phosphatase [Phycisphaeraceae bacterium]|nr:PP2C family protein-serine/threonine phosphatase [Phycisphaeraceae bacterium]